jgi:hypothetical protein
MCDNFVVAHFQRVWAPRFPIAVALCPKVLVASTGSRCCIRTKSDVRVNGQRNDRVAASSVALIASRRPER